MPSNPLTSRVNAWERVSGAIKSVSPYFVGGHHRMVRHTFDELDIDYRDILRHWHSDSKAYAAVDQLLHALNSGWVIDGHVHYREHPFSRMRRTMIYYFRLSRGEEIVIMPVINNPHIERLITISPLEFICINAQVQSEVEDRCIKTEFHDYGDETNVEKTVPEIKTDLQSDLHSIGDHPGRNRASGGRFQPVG